MTDTASLIEDIIIRHRERMFAMEQRKRANLALGSFLRTTLGWRLSLPQAERDAINSRALDMIAAIERMVWGKDASHDVPEEMVDIICAAIQAREPFDKIETKRTKQLEHLGKQLPVWPWAEPIRGFGPGGLATIVAEAGRDISEYRSVAALWTRMGVGIRGDVRQGGLPKTASKEEWILHGYSPRRRSRMWNVGHALVLSNGDGKYRQAYLARKEYERAKAEAEGLVVLPAAKIPKGKPGYRSVGHIDRRAQRYMEKMLLRDLWVEWRRVTRLQSQPERVMSPPLDPEDMAAE
jgi:hypothetical protein